MRSRSILSTLGIQLLAFGLAVGEPASTVSAKVEQSPVSVTSEEESGSESGSASQSTPSMMTGTPVQSAYITHAPLALFSLSSLAVGGIFYSIQSGMESPKVGFIGGDRSSLGTAVGFAGVTALVAGVSYFYYSHRDSQRAHSWDAQVSGGLAPNGKLDVSAALVLPLPSLLP
jgi:hypothetical protein